MKYEERTIVLFDDAGEEYWVWVKTNAPSGEIEEAIEYKNDLLLRDELETSDFEAIQNYLYDRGYSFEQFNNDLEKYYW